MKRSQKPQTTKAEVNFRVIADNTYDWEYWISPDGQVLYNSPSCERITGYAPAEFQADPELRFRIIHPDDRVRYDEHLKLDQSAKSAHEVEFRIFHRDGSVRWIGHVCQPVFDEQKKFLGRRGSNREITDRKQAEEALRLAEQRFRALTENAAEMITILDAEGKILYASHGAERLLSRSVNRLLGRHAFELVHPDDRDDAGLMFEDLLRLPGVIRRVELRLQHSDGTWRVLDMVARNLLHDPAVQGIVVNSRDVTERRQIDQSLHLSEARFRLLADAVPIGIFLTDPAGNCLFVNKRWMEIAGMTMEQATGKGWKSAIHPDDRVRVAEEWYAAARAGQEFASKYRFQTPDGRVTKVHGTGIAQRTEDKVVLGYIGTITEIEDSP